MNKGGEEMKRIMILSIVLIFCVNSLAQEKIATLGTDPIYRNVPDAETVRQIIKDKENVVRTALNDDSLCRILYDQIDEVEIKEEQIEKGQKIIWMIFGREPNKTKIKRNLEWIGKPFDAFVFLILAEDYKYRYEYKFIVPKPCGNISLTEIHRAPKDLEPEVKPESKPSLRPELEPLKIYPSRISSLRKNFQFRVLYQFNKLFSLDFSPEDYDLWMLRRIDYYFGNWNWWCWDTKRILLCTNDELDVEPGDIVPLYLMRRVDWCQAQNPFGFELEAKIWKPISFVVGYHQGPKFCISSTEEADFLEFEEFKDISPDPNQGYYLYDMKLNRFWIVQSMTERFSFRSIQAYVKAELGLESISMFVGAGVDFAWGERKVETRQSTYGLILLTDELISKDEETSQMKDSKSSIRPLAVAGIQVNVLENLAIGFQGKYLINNKALKFQKQFLLPIGDLSDNWQVQLTSYRLEAFVNFSF